MANRNKPLTAQQLSTERAVVALTQHNSWRKHSPARQLDLLFAGLPAADFYAQVGPNSAMAQLYAHCVAGRKTAEVSQSQQFLRDLAAKRSTLLDRDDLTTALAHLSQHYGARLRELADWQPKRKNPHHQLESLIRHLFDRYGDVPDWVIGGWNTAVSRKAVNLPKLTLHLGRGESLRSFAKLPVPLTKRLEHEMRQAPAACTFQEAYLYAQLAVRDALDWFGVVLESRLGREPLKALDDGFWLGVLDFYRAAPMVDPWQLGPVCDWIHFRRAVGTPTEPAQPGFSLRGRDVASVLVHTTRWHRGLAYMRRYSGYDVPLYTTWPGLPVPDFVGGDENRIRITQLRTFGQLVEEGRALHHCVASYVYSCQKGRCGIFGFTVEGVRAITLEVNQDRIVVQARGRHNRPLSDSERHWVTRWLGEARLALATYV